MLFLLIVFSSLFASTSCSDLDPNDTNNSSQAIPVSSSTSVISSVLLSKLLQIFFLLLLVLLMYAPATVSLSFVAVAVGAGATTAGTAYVAKRAVDSLPPDDKKHLFADPISYSLSHVRNFVNNWIHSLLPSWAKSVSVLATSSKNLCSKRPLLCGLAAAAFGWFVLPIAGIVYTVYAFIFLVQWESHLPVIFPLLSLFFSSMFSRSFVLGTIVSLIGLGFMMMGNHQFGIKSSFIAASFFAAAFLQILWSVFNSVFPHLVPSYFVQGILEAAPANISIPATIAASGSSENESGSAKGWRINSPESIVIFSLLGIVVIWFVVVVVMRVILRRRSMENPPSSDPQSEVHVSRLSL